MNRVYRVIWSRTRRCLVVVHERAKAFGKGSSTVRQDTQRLIATWDSFDIGAEAAVTFRQPGAASVALNRVLGQDPSRILGRLSANGHVMLVNPNGVVFGPNSRVNVGGITATTLDMADADFLAGDYRFANGGAAGLVANHGAITAEGGVVALVAPVVQNAGTIATPGGSTTLAAADAVTLDFTGDGLVTVTVDKARLDALVANGGAVRADEGVVVLSAGAAREALSGAVNNTGIIEARGLVADGGRIVLEGGTVTQAGTLDASSAAGRGGRVEIAATEIALTGDSRIDATGAAGGGTVHVGGAWQGGGDGPEARTVTMAEGAVIDASATERGDGGEVVLWSDVGDAAARTAVAGTIRAEGGTQGGDGGRVETSGHDLDIAATAKVSTRAPAGAAGRWLLDPQDFIIAESGGDITGATLSSSLANGNVEILSSSGGTAGNGDILVNDAVSWSANTLTLTAARDIRINAVMSASGAAALTMNTATANGSDDAVSGGTIRVGFAADGTFAGRVDYSATGALTINGTAYTVITELGQSDDYVDTHNTLQGAAGNLSGHYVLGADIDASATADWNNGAGFIPLGAASNPFTGTFDGLGHVIQNLTISRSGTNERGLIGVVSGGAIVRNVGLEGGSVAANSYVGALVGYNYGTVSNAYATTSVCGDGFYVGGLVGYNKGGTITNSHAAGSVSGRGIAGGLVGDNDGGSITNSHATGSVSGTDGVGGLVGNNYSTAGSEALISNAYATGSVSGTKYVGGLVGENRGGITNAYATGSVTGNERVGGLIGDNVSGDVSTAYSTGEVTGQTDVGGLLGRNHTGTVSASYWDTQTTKQASGIGTDGNNQGGSITGLTTAEMTDPFTFIDAGWDFAGVWGKSRGGENSGYMVLRALSDAYDYHVRLSDTDTTKTYGDLSLDGVTVDGVGADNVALAIAAGTDVGTYSYGDAGVLAPQFSAGTAADYYFDYGSGTLTIEPRPLTVTADDKTKTYDGQRFTAFTASYNGLAPGEDESVLGGSLTFGGAAATATDTGSYTITLSGLSSNNYAISYADGTLTIAPRPLTVTGGFGVQDKAFDGTTAATISRNELVLSNVVNGDAVDLVPVAAFAQAHAGQDIPVRLTAATALAGADAANYTLDLTGAPTAAADIIKQEEPRPPSAEPDGGGSATFDGANGGGDPILAAEPIIALSDGEAASGADTGSAVGDEASGAAAVGLAGASDAVAAGGAEGGGRVVLGDEAGGALAFRLAREGDTAALVVEGGDVGDVGGGETRTLPVFTRGQGVIEAQEPLRVTRERTRWSAAPAGGAGAAPPVPVLGRVLLSAEASVTLPNGHGSAIEVSVTEGGVLLVRAPAETQGAVDQAHLVLLALSIAAERLDINPAEVAAVVFQWVRQLD